MPPFEFFDLIFSKVKKKVVAVLKTQIIYM